MRLGVNAMRLSGQRLGVGRYIEYLVKYWTRMTQPDDRVTLYVREPMGEDRLELPDGFGVEVLRPALTGVLWEHLLLSGRARELDVLFCPSYTMPLSYRGRCVVANHSVNEARSGAHPWWYHWTYRQRYRLSALKADAVIVPSLAAKQGLEEDYGVAGEKIEIIPQGVDEAFRPTDDEELLRATRRRLVGDDRPYILFVGKLSRRRNIPVLMTAFAALKRQDQIPHRLLLFGPNHENLPLAELAAELGISDSVVQTDGKIADHTELVPIYGAADLFVHPSLAEGFSLTIIEAMACGVPVITVNRGAIAELAGGAAELVDAPDPESVAGAMRRVLGDPALRADLRARGLERARSYRYEETARRTLDILRRVARK